ncbi:MAG: hypothetical protein WC587_01620 [Candidatus Paceibacterota bacterium]
MKNIKKWVLAISIVVVLNLFFNYGIYTFYKNPKFENFCKPELNSNFYTTRQACEAVGGLWNENFPKAVPMPAAPAENVRTGNIQTGYCDVYHTCQKDFNKTEAIYNRNVFIILVPLGLISLVVGLLMGISGAVSTGLSFGGILSMIIGSIRYWSDMNDYLRFGLLGVALIILIWLGIRKFKD